MSEEPVELERPIHEEVGVVTAVPCPLENDEPVGLLEEVDPGPGLLEGDDGPRLDELEEFKLETGELLEPNIGVLELDDDVS